ncbi:integrase, catalytic region, zinc finger, CCHC-type containing protein, partial [Tanacetum coccineum]
DGLVDIQTKNAGYGGNANKNAGRNRTQGFNAGDESNQIIQRVPRIESTPGKANVQCYNCNEKGHYARECQKPKVRNAKYFREQMLLAMKNEAGSNLSNRENDFMIDTSYGEDLEELTAAVMLMARLQPANENAETVPSYDAKVVSHVHASSKVHEQVSQGKRKTIIQTTDDNQIDSNIIFDDPFVENNGGTSEHDSTAHDEYREIQMLAYNVQREAENQKRLNNELKKQKDLLQRELETFKDWVKTIESKTIQYSTYKETCDELERELRNDNDTIDRLVKGKEKIQNDFFKVENEKIIIQHETRLEKKAFKEREDRYLDDILDLEEKLSSHDRIIYKMGQSIQTIHMLRKKPNKVYDPFLKAGLGYKNHVRLKKAIAAQPKMYDCDLSHNNKLGIHTTDSEETLEDAEESRNKMRHKMVQIDYEKLNVLYETFVPQQELSAEQTYFSISSTSDNSSTSKDVLSESPGPKMPTESRLLTMIDTLGDTIIGFQTRINKKNLQDTERRWLSDSQNELREFYKTDVIPMSRSLYKTLSEIKEELNEEVQEMLNIFVSMKQKVNDKSPTENTLENEIDRLLEASLTSEIRNCVLLSVEQQKHELLKVKLEKSASDSRDIQANLLKRIKILENDFQRSQAQSIDFELKLQHQKEKMDCDVSWKAKLSTLHDENVLLKHQVESTVKERENIKLEFQKLFNSIKATRAQHQNEINEMFEDVTQKTYDYADVRAQNQDLLMTIYELKNKLKMINKGKHVNTKFDKSETLRQLLCVTPFNTNLAIKAKNVSNTKVVEVLECVGRVLLGTQLGGVKLLAINPVHKTELNGFYGLHQNEINEIFEDVTPRRICYADVRAQNQDLLMTISELKSKLKMIDKGKHMNTKFDKSDTLRKLLDRSKPVTSQSTPTIEQKQQHNTNVIARGMYKINQEDTKTKDSKANTNVSNSTGVGSSNSVRRPKSKDNKSKNNVLKNTKSSSTYVLKTTNSVCLDSNKCETKPSNVCQTNACRTSSKTVNAVNDGLNMLCISCGLDVFLHSHEKCVARNALTRKSSVKRALFTSPITVKSKGLGATSVVAKSRFSVAKTPITRTKVIQLVLWIVDSRCLKHMTCNLQLLRNFVEKFMGTVHFGNDHFAAITGYGDYVQGNLTICHVYYVEGLRNNLFSVGQFCDEDLEFAF